MPVVKSEFISPIRFEVVFNIPAGEYQKWHERIMDQVLSRVEVAGYRPGKAPREKLLVNTNLEKVNQVIFEETIDRYAKEAIDAAVVAIKADSPDHHIVNHNIDQGDTKTDDDGFSFTVVTSLLPLIDLAPLESLSVAEPTDDELGVITFEDFKKQEAGKFLFYFNTYQPTTEPTGSGSKLTVDLTGTVDGSEIPELGGQNQEICLGFGRYLEVFEAGLMNLQAGDKKEFEVAFPGDYFVTAVQAKTVNFTADVKTIEKAKYNTIEDLLLHSDAKGLKSQIPDLEAFQIHLEKSYASLRQQTLNTKVREKTIRSVLQAIPKFDVPQDDMDKEFNRIQANTKNIATENKITLAEVLKANGIPYEQEPKTDAEVEQALHTYIENEFRLSLILNFVYIKQVPQNRKVTPEQISEIADAMVANPNEYGLAPRINKDQATREANERAVRNIGLEWVIEKVVK